MCFRCFDITSRSEKNVALHFNKLEFPSPKFKYALCQVWMKLAKWLWRKKIKISKFRQCIFAISSLYHFGKARILSFEQNWTPFPQECLASNLVEIGSVVPEIKMWKVYGQTDRQTTEKLIWAFNVEKPKNYLT